jgi:hypothetical protein
MCMCTQKILTNDESSLIYKKHCARAHTVHKRLKGTMDTFEG